MTGDTRQGGGGGGAGGAVWRRWRRGVSGAGDGGDPGRHPEGGGVPADGGGAGPGGLVLRLQQPGRPGAPQDLHRGPGRAVLAAAGAPGGEQRHGTPLMHAMQ
ncbi:hypothetical protein EYF80_067013 [Liparis tanakae]|uniref:Uncharacterized protein n=1 Tax=Liparis tanakae TaxID=230148 RepID=A0A4Z2E2A4_9TELE|nr:hypothetical protein EYF80_067013 [Liparis tanakae]